MSEQAQILPGTLELLILKGVFLGPLPRLRRSFADPTDLRQALLIEQGALYPALLRLVRQGMLKANWGTSQNNRRPKFYEHTPAGRKRFWEQTEGWNRPAAAMIAALGAKLEEA